MFSKFAFHPTRKTIVISSIIGIIIIVTAIVSIAYIVERQKVATRIKNDLLKVESAMAVGFKQTNAYPTTIPSSAATNDGVTLTGGGSFDGVSYCVTGTAQYANKPVALHIDSTTESQGPQPDSCVTATDITPGVPSELVIDNVNPESITSSWDTSATARAYILECATNSQFTAGVVSVRTTTTRADCMGLNDSSLYFVRVKGLNSTTEGKWSVPITATTLLLSVMPQNFKATPTSSTQVSYSWDPVAGASSYNLQQSTDVNFIGNLVNISLTRTSGVASGLKPNTTYYYHVEAIAPGFSTLTAAYSQELIVTTPK